MGPVIQPQQHLSQDLDIGLAPLSRRDLPLGPLRRSSCRLSTETKQVRCTPSPSLLATSCPRPM